MDVVLFLMIMACLISGFLVLASKPLFVDLVLFHLAASVILLMYLIHFREKLNRK